MKQKEASSAYVMSHEELHALQTILVKMLEEVNRICKKNNIRYSIIGGTMLGAVRHKGFIPWDDDLDVAMIRDEYLKFREACKTDLDRKRFFYQDHTTDPHYPWGYARLRYKNSEFVRLGQEHMKMRTGIFLDIFPIDNVPDNKALRGLHCFYCFLLRKILYAESGRVNGKNAFLRGIYTVLNFIPRSFTFRRIDNLTGHPNTANVKHTNNTRYVRILTFPLPKHRVYGMKREWFEDLADIEFEGRLFPGARDRDGFLSYYYGDYMTLPPPNKRRWHPAAKFRLPGP